MRISVDVPPDLEAPILDAVSKEGVDEEGFVLDAVRDRLRTVSLRQQKRTDRLSAQETALLQKINQALPEEVWARYSELVKLRRAERLSADQHRDLLELSGQIEEDHVQRIEHLVALAQLWNMSLDSVMKQLDIKPRPV